MTEKYSAYPEYKDSGVEWLRKLPSHWEAKRLGQFFDERREKVSDKDYAALSVTMQGIVPQLETAAKTDAGDNRKLVRENDFVINSRSDRKGSSGVSPSDGSVSLISIVLEPRNIEPLYVHHLLRSYPFQEEFYRFGKGIVADLWSTNSSEMKNILIPAIPLPEQTQIAKFLDHETAKIDRLIEKQQTLIALLKEKRQAVISHAVTKGLPSTGSEHGPPKAPACAAEPDAAAGRPLKDSGVEWLGQVPEHWVPSSIKYLSANVGTGGTPKKENSFTDVAEVPWFTPGDFNDQGELTSASKHITQLACRSGDAKTYPAGSVIVIGIGATLGKVGYSRQEFSCNQQVNIITPNSKISEAYMMHALSVQTEQMRQLSNASTIGIMNQEKTKLIKIAVPPPAEQNLIVEFIDMKSWQYATLLDSASSQITLLQERRTALISAAVTGKIDVRDWMAPQEPVQNVE